MLKDFEEYLKKLEEEHNRVVEENLKLRDENIALQSEHYKNEELSRLEKTNRDLSRRCSHYSLHDEDYEKMMEWWDNHLQSKHKNYINPNRDLTKYNKMPSYYFEIKDLSVCTCYTIKCDHCDGHFDIFY